MARAQGTSNVVSNPSKIFISWKNPTETNGIKNPGFYYYVKSEIEGEKGKDVMVEFPFTFQYLQDAVGIGGFVDKRKKNIFSNEVLDIYETPFDIKIWGDDGEEVLKSGFYYTDQKVAKSEMSSADFKSLKALIKKEANNGTLENITKKVNGSKKCKILYILVDEEIWRMKLEGGKLQAWGDFQKDKNSNAYKGDDKNLVNFIVWDGVKTVENKLGADYDVPTFVYEKATPIENKAAQDVYEDQIKPYFEFILGKPKEEVTDYN